MAANSIDFTVGMAIRAALTPRYGGEIVEQLEMVTSAEDARTYRWSQGYVIEVTCYGAVISHIEAPRVLVRTVDLEDIARAGDAWPDAVELAAQTTLDKQQHEARNQRRLDAAGGTFLATAAEVEDAFLNAQTLGNLLTGAAERSYRAVRASEPLLSAEEVAVFAATVAPAVAI